MSMLEDLKEVVAENRVVRSVEEGICSIFSQATHEHPYDKRAAAYDFVVGTRLYNRVMWGGSPLDYTAFARQAVRSNVGGRFLDAGCGSLLFTAQVYLECDRQIIAFDQSLEMLKRARARLIKLAGSMPEHVLLLQADLGDLAFRPASFHNVLCMNVLHLYEEAATLVSNLNALLAPGGHLYVTSLVAHNRFIGDNYLSLLHRTGEFIRPRTNTELCDLLKKHLGQSINYRVKGNMAYASAVAS
jgi:SAM-dependent methyltransferase